MNRKFKYVLDGCAPKDANTVEQLLGFKRELNLKYKSSEELTASLKTMNLLDMQSLAVELGVKPCNDRKRLVRACTDQFVRLTKTYGSAKVKNKDINFDPSNF